jgi:hypothetical protein
VISLLLVDAVGLYNKAPVVVVVRKTIKWTSVHMANFSCHHILLE